VINQQNGKAQDRNIFEIYDSHKSYSNPHAFSGCCFMFKKELFLQHGLFDDSLYMYYEDVDFFWRLQKDSALKIKLVDKAIIRHDFRSTHNPMKKYYIDRNRLIVLCTHGQPIDIFRAYVLYFVHVVLLFLKGSDSKKMAFEAFIDALFYLGYKRKDTSK
jgi:GT2 family glycosyltransferase